MCVYMYVCARNKQPPLPERLALSMAIIIIIIIMLGWLLAERGAAKLMLAAGGFDNLTGDGLDSSQQVPDL